MNDSKIESRSLEISDFRNLGITDPSVKSRGKAILKLNRSLKKDELGGVVIILGNNNSGKTNVLSALEKVRKKDFDEEDYTDFVKVRQNPHLDFSVADGKYGIIASPNIVRGQERCTMQGKFQNVLLYLLKQKESYELFKRYIITKTDRKADIEDYMNNNDAFIKGSEEYIDDSLAYAYILKNRSDIQCGYIGELIDALESGWFASVRNKEIILSAKGTEIDEVALVDEDYGRLGDLAGIKATYVRKDRLKEYLDSQKGFKSVFKKTASFIKTSKKVTKDPEVRIIDFAGGMKETQVVKDRFSEVYGYNLSCNVYHYNRRKISDKDFETGVDIFDGFIPSLFASLGYSPENLLSSRYLSSTESLEKLEHEINSELESLSRMFNNLLNFNGRPYSMSVRIGDRKIAFTLKCGETKLRIDHQSEGFRWLFEFYFNFLLSNKFVAGDIVVVDEYGGLLNPGTVRELTANLRSFGKKNGITFILATQNPMAVDIAHLDEIRIVSPKEDGPAYILNDFTEFYTEDADALKPITGCLTVGRDYLRSIRVPTVFVESAEDYFVLRAYSHLVGTVVDIIPVNCGKNKVALAENLKRMEHRPVLLTSKPDTDEGLDNILETYGITTVNVKDLGFDSTLGALSTGDRATLSDNTSFDSLCTMGNRLTEMELSPESVENIRKLMDYISM